MSAAILVRIKGKLYGGSMDLKDFFISMIMRGINCHGRRCRIMYRKKCVARGVVTAYWGDPDNHRADLPHAQTLEHWRELLSTTKVTLSDGKTVQVCPEDNVVTYVCCDWIKAGFCFNRLPYHIPHEY